MQAPLLCLLGLGYSKVTVTPKQRCHAAARYTSTSSEEAAEPPEGASYEQADFQRIDYNLSSKRCSAMRAGDASSFTCPQRCRVACCAQEDAQDNVVLMSRQHFRQCSVQACWRSCGFRLIEPVIAGVSAPLTARVVGLYLAQKSKGKPSKAAATRKGGGSRGCAGSLC
jgi:hypothetical protein